MKRAAGALRQMPLRPYALIAATAAAVIAPTATAAQLPTILTQDPHRPFVTRPGSIAYTGDGTGVIGGTDGTSVRHPGHLRWTLYTRRQGAARGVVWLDDCEPSCAGGEFSSTPVTVHAFAPLHGHFTRLTLQYTYHGKRVTDRRGIRHIRGSDGVAGSWVYYIVSIDPPGF